MGNLLGLKEDIKVHYQAVCQQPCINYGGINYPLDFIKQQIDVAMTSLKLHQMNSDYIRGMNHQGLVNQLSQQLMTNLESWNFTKTINSNDESNLLVNSAISLVSGTQFDPMVGMYFILSKMLDAVRGSLVAKLSDDWFEYPSMYTIGSAEPGTQKSRVVEKLVRPFREFEAKFNENNTHFSSENVALVKRSIFTESAKHIRLKFKSLLINNDDTNFEDCKDSIYNILQSKKEIEQRLIGKKLDLFINSCTSTQLAAALTKNSECLSLIEAEGDLLNDFSKDGELVNIYKRAYGFENYKRESTRNSFNLQNPCLQTLIFTQPSEVLRFVNNDRLHMQGLPARFAIFHCDQGGNLSISNNTMAVYENKVKNLLSLFCNHSGQRNLVMLSVDSQAVKAALEFRNFIHERFIGNVSVRAVFSLRKLHGLAVRLALAHCIWNNDNPLKATITLSDMNCGISLASILLNHIVYTYDQMGLAATNVARKIVSNLLNVSLEERGVLIANGLDTGVLAKRVGLRMSEVEFGCKRLQWHNMLRIYDSGNVKNKIALHPNFFNQQTLNLF